MYYIGCIKQKNAFEHVHNLPTEIILHNHKVSSGHLLSIIHSGPSCSKLTMLLVNVSLKLWLLNIALYTNIFAEKNTCELDIVLTRTVNILTTNKLVKLTML